MQRVGIALGSNLGDKLANIRAATEKLRSIAVPGEPFLTSSIYETEPVHCPPGSPQFYNSVVEMAFDGEPPELLASTQGIERELGRTAGAERNAPRVIDVDVLYYGEKKFAIKGLIVPHPRIGERRFVLQPLAEIRPGLVLPKEDRYVVTMLAMLDSTEPPLIKVRE